jgi:L-fuconolactonase
MARSADAHAHLFEGGYRGSFVGRPGVVVDEASCYASLLADHDLEAALIVGYQGHDWCAENNSYLADILPVTGWMRPVAFVHLDRQLSVAQLTALQQQGFVGISLYVFGDHDRQGLARIPSACWAWLSGHNWVVSVNSSGTMWRAWQPILDQHPDLRLLVSHLGLPPPQINSPMSATAETLLADVLALGRWPGPRVKLSGFYALSKPGHDFPHRATWPYVAALVSRFGTHRLLWGSDFSPCLDDVSFPQALGILQQLPDLTAPDRAAIGGENLLELLDQIGESPRSGRSTPAVDQRP